MSAEDEGTASGRVFAPSSALPLEEAIHSLDPEELRRAVADPALSSELALSLLKRGDIPAEVLEDLSKKRSVLKARKVKIALASHPKTPRHVSVPLVRQFYTFDLMKVALSPTVAGDVKKTADDVLVSRLKTVTLGERQTLARQASSTIAGALLLDGEPRIMRAALENGRLTEAAVLKAVLKPEANAGLIQAVAQHAKWSYRRDVQIALLRTEHLSLARALAFASSISTTKLREILQNSRLPTRIKEQLLREKQKSR